jgi:excisionase family DNA binding protein
VPRRPKRLEQLVREGSFRARRHDALLAGPELRWPAFATLQHKYLGCSSSDERYAVALEFERAVRGAQKQAKERTRPAQPGQQPSAPEAKAPPKPAIARLALSPDEAARALGVSRDFFDEHLAPELRIIRRGRRKLIPVRELERWLSEQASYALEGAR